MPALDLDRFTVKPGRKVSLADWDTDEDCGLTKAEGEERLARNLATVDELQMKFWANRKRAMLVVLQGIDTAGKDGVIRKVMTALNPQGVTVHSFKKPSDAEAAHDYLWRVHSRCPARGEVAVFNRSHYEDVIVGRVHGFLERQEIARRHRQINDFERMLSEEGTTILKLFLHISKEEQKRRLESRLAQPAKHWKFNPEDLRDRVRFGEFLDAYSDVISATSTPYAPWHIIPADRKWYRNVVVAKLVVDTLKKLKLSYPPPAFDPATIKIED